MGLGASDFHGHCKSREFSFFFSFSFFFLITPHLSFFYWTHFYLFVYLNVRTHLTELLKYNSFSVASPILSERADSVVICGVCAIISSHTCQHIQTCKYAQHFAADT